MKFLPDKLGHFEVRAHQGVPGQEKYAAEAIYEPEKQSEDKARIPYDVYAKVTYYSNPSEAKARAAEVIKSRYPNKVASTLRNNIRIQTGYEEGFGGFYIAYEISGYLIELHTNYLIVTPADRGTDLEDSTWRVFDGIYNEASKVLSGEGRSESSDVISD